MKVIIAGSRTVRDFDAVRKAVIESKFDVTEVVSGGARGVDALGERLARYKSRSVRGFPALWKKVDAPGAIVKDASWGKYNARAGMDRNELMAHYADAAILVWDGKSPGTRDMLERMRKLDKPVYIYKV